MKREKKAKEVVSRPVGRNKEVVRAKAVLSSKSKAKKSKMAVSAVNVGFSFEEEIARYVHSVGLDQFQRMGSIMDDDVPVSLDEDVVEAVAEEPVSYLNSHDDVIEKFSRNRKEEEKDGWEAFYE